jgi:hypothetical protein
MGHRVDCRLQIEERRKAQGKSLNSLKSLKPFKSQAKLAPTGDFGAEIVFCTLLAARLS